MKLSINFSSSGASMSATLLVALLSSLVMGGEAESNWKVLDTVSLPTPLADNTATYIPASVTTKDTITSTGSAEEIGARTRSRRRTQESATATSTTTFIRGGVDFKMERVPARIYISGGCDADSILFGLECESISSKLYGFIPSSDTTMDNTGYVTTQTTGAIETLADMPRPRYKHSAVATSDGRLWLIGGRTIPDDTIIPEVDVSKVYCIVLYAVRVCVCVCVLTFVYFTTNLKRWIQLPPPPLFNHNNKQHDYTNTNRYMIRS